MQLESIANEKTRELLSRAKELDDSKLEIKTLQEKRLETYEILAEKSAEITIISSELERTKEDCKFIDLITYISPIPSSRIPYKVSSLRNS